MKRRILFTLALVLTFFAGAPIASAEGGTDDAYPTSYVFPVRWQGGVPSAGGEYWITYGGALPAAGSWTVQVVAQSGAVIASYALAPGEGTADLAIPMAPNGYRVRLLDAEGSERLAWHVAASRVCVENGSCEGQYGEDSGNCPADCGAPAVADVDATVATGFPVAASARLWVLALAPLAAIGLVVYMDRRRQ